LIFTLMVSPEILTVNAICCKTVHNNNRLNIQAACGFSFSGAYTAGFMENRENNFMRPLPSSPDLSHGLKGYGGPFLLVRRFSSIRSMIFMPRMLISSPLIFLILSLMSGIESSNPCSRLKALNIMLLCCMDLLAISALMLFTPRKKVS